MSTELFLEFASEQIVWFIGLGLIIGFLIFSYTKDRFSGYKKVSPVNSVQIINSNAKLVDVRKPEEFKSKHIKNSLNIPAGELLEKFNVKFRNKSQTFLLVCNNGLTCDKPARSLAKIGYENMYILDGGLNAWEDASLPVFSSSKKK